MPQRSRGSLCYYTIVSLKLDFKTAREGGMAFSAVWTLVYLLATDSHWNQGACQSTQAVPPARRDALCPLLKSKSKLLLVLDPVSLPEKGSCEFYYGWLAGMSPAFGTRRNKTVRFFFSAPGMDTAKGG